MTERRLRCSLSYAAAVSLRRDGFRKLHAVAPRPFGDIHGRVRARDQMLTPYAQHVAGRDSDAAGQTDRLAVPLDPYVGDPAQDSLRDGPRGRSVRAVQDHDELFSAIASDDVGLS